MVRLAGPRVCASPAPGAAGRPRAADGPVAEGRRRGVSAARGAARLGLARSRTRSVADGVLGAAVGLAEPALAAAALDARGAPAGERALGESCCATPGHSLARAAPRVRAALGSAEPRSGRARPELGGDDSLRRRGPGLEPGRGPHAVARPATAAAQRAARSPRRRAELQPRPRPRLVAATPHA